MRISNFYEGLIDTLYGERLWLSQSKALLFLCLKGNVASITIFIIQGLERPAVQTADLLEGFRDGKPS